QGAVPPSAVGQALLIAFLIEMDRQPLGLALGVIFERLGERSRGIGGAHAFGLHQACERAVRGFRRLAGAGEKKAQQIARRLARGERLPRQARGKLALEAQHQLDARQAVEPQLALERAVERDVGLEARTRFARHFGDEGEQPVGVDGRAHGLRASVHSLGVAPFQDRLVSIARAVSFPGGARLVRQGETSRGAFLIRTGEVEAQVALPGGGMLTVAELGEGDMFGEMALIERGVCSASVIARSAVEGWFVARDDFRAFVASRDPAALDVPRAITRVLAEKLRALNDKVRDHPAEEDRSARLAPAAADPLGGMARSGKPSFDWRRFLPLLPVFERFDAYEAEQLLSISNVLELPRGSWLFGTGSAANACFLVVRGAVEVISKSQDLETRVALAGAGVIAAGAAAAMAGVRPGIALWLFLAILAASAAAAAAMAVATRLSFQSGFFGYLNQVEAQRLDALTATLAAEYRRHGDWGFVRDNYARLRELAAPAQPVQRLALLDEARRRVVGNPELPEDAAVRPVIVDDRIVGWIGQAPFRRLSSAAELSFQQEQLRAAWIIAGLALALAACVAIGLARA